jgi:hypothetical protein
MQCGLLLRAEVSAEPLVHTQEGKTLLSSLRLVPYASCVVGTYTLFAVSQTHNPYVPQSLISLITSIAHCCHL